MAPTQQIERSFQRLYGCDAAEVAQLGANRYQATGCGHVMAYKCNSEVCEEDESKTPIGDLPSAEPKVATVKVFELNLSLTGAAGAMATLRASPQETENVTVAVWTRRTSCPLEVMVDGQRLALPPDPSEPLGVVMSRAFVRDMGLARQMAFRHCDQRWSLDRAQLADLHAFVARYEEELAWRDEPRNSATAGRQAPLGGWPPWKGLSAMAPASTGGGALPPTQLFQKLAPSVLRVEGVQSEGFSQGSAVAVTPSLVLTNCHVVESASKIVVKQGKTTWSTRLVQSHPSSDRCVLEVSPANLTPVSGVRAYSDLKVGEPLYTLGNPSGLDLSISDGMLSGLRSDDGVRYAQTSAPISPGSSGGGLFDSQGNLVGITTLVLAGEQRLNQSLNFAIAADMFWQP